ncbi:uncharacterized protein LOC103961608 isoform X2 [Pyrus x bretschneideri]|uniref:uncharacterized protein LOC103961608 isoform X2 n=1 Tax=Pyrus x bretschneideri TaxID=225117 RepID=UPI00203061A3|nr:uncharacterized protein LOC103961608 isoform X2 [Pyrus x bretschneideri]
MKEGTLINNFIKETLKSDTQKENEDMIAQLKDCKPRADQQHLQRMFSSKIHINVRNNSITTRERQNHFIRHARKARMDKMKKKKDGVKGESIQEALEVVMVIFQMTMIPVLN